MAPCIGTWPHFEIRYRRALTTYVIRRGQSQGVSGHVRRITLTASVCGDAIPLIDDGREHAVHVVVDEAT
jgi:hypothetical protein